MLEKRLRGAPIRIHASSGSQMLHEVPDRVCPGIQEDERFCGDMEDFGLVTSYQIHLGIQGFLISLRGSGFCQADAICIPDGAAQAVTCAIARA